MTGVEAGAITGGAFGGNLVDGKIDWTTSAFISALANAEDRTTDVSAAQVRPVQ